MKTPWQARGEKVKSNEEEEQKYHTLSIISYVTICITSIIFGVSSYIYISKGYDGKIPKFLAIPFSLAFMIIFGFSGIWVASAQKPKNKIKIAIVFIFFSIISLVYCWILDNYQWNN